MASTITRNSGCASWSGISSPSVVLPRYTKCPRTQQVDGRPFRKITSVVQYLTKWP